MTDADSGRWESHAILSAVVIKAASTPLPLLRLLKVCYSSIASRRCIMGDRQQNIAHSICYYADSTGVQSDPSERTVPVTYYPISADTESSDTSHQFQRHFQHSIDAPYDISTQAAQTVALEGHIRGRFIY